MLEVLVAILLLSFGMLAMGVMLSFAVQMPKTSGYRATAVNMAANHIERIRANPGGFRNDAYRLSLSYDGTSAAIAQSDCIYPNCNEASLATMDNSMVKAAARLRLPAGGVLLTCDATPCAENAYGNLWIIWQEPVSRTAVDPQTADNCPDAVTSGFTNPRPRCVYVRFKA